MVYPLIYEFDNQLFFALDKIGFLKNNYTYIFTF